MSKKTDNHNPDAKLALRRHFLRKYHADGSIAVLDCCQASGRLWGVLRREFAIASYWGVDVKPKPARLKIDSVRILDQPGVEQNVIDIDTYGSPFKHWFALLRNCRQSVTVFLTIGFSKQGSGNRLCASLVAALGLNFRKVKLPITLGGALWPLAVPIAIAAARDHGFEIVECLEAANPRTRPGATPARYIGVRLEKIAPARERKSRANRPGKAIPDAK